MRNVARSPGLDHPGLVRRTQHVRRKRGWDRSDPCTVHKAVHGQQARPTELLAAGWAINTG